MLQCKILRNLCPLKVIDINANAIGSLPQRKHDCALCFADQTYPYRLMIGYRKWMFAV